ncbi:Riboflavin transporter MCH5 [Smittium mucronatum]|uniref:Riboflavin transporter MCH5 n=1 Tax=Smittium mucronatum TaxID=133383 RepID=A0A1R0H1C4_9FUNG|nr:Riboflavin transporter MCH5 [Smittium mucronatum]
MASMKSNSSVSDNSQDDFNSRPPSEHMIVSTTSTIHNVRVELSDINSNVPLSALSLENGEKLGSDQLVFSPVSAVSDIKGKQENDQENNSSNIPPPDKGYAWVIVVACFLNLMFAFGIFNAFGVFQTYYLTTMFVNESASKVAWISTICGTVTFVGGLAAGPIVRRLGLKHTSMLGTIICFAGLLLASFSDQIWQLILTQGLVFGFGSSIIINISLTVPALWFDKERSLAYGLIASGGGFGALVLIPIVNKVISASSVHWAFRVLSFIYLVVTGACSFLLKPRIGYTPSDVIIDFKLLRNPVTIALCIVGFFMQIGYNVPALYFPSELVKIGISRTKATDYIMVFCTCTALSRGISGYAAKHIKPATIMFVCHIITGIIMMAMWYTSSNFGVLMAFYVILGFVCIPYLTLGSAVASSYFKPEDVSQVNALCYLAMGFSAIISLPSVGAIFQNVGHRTDYSSIIIIGSVSYFLSGLACIYLRYALKDKPVNPA